MGLKKGSIVPKNCPNAQINPDLPVARHITGRSRINGHIAIAQRLAARLRVRQGQLTSQ